ncbi:MAG: IclR family transcriptional regulator [Burkholderiaceae bacterium]
MTDKSMSSLTRMLSVLDLFSDHQLTWTAEAITEALQVSLPTGYRYVKMLTDAGLLQRAADSQYTLGPRIIVLDHYIRMADPVLRHGVPFMAELVEQTGLDCVISGLYGQQVLDTHREFGQAPATLSYGRGRPRPLFLGAAPKVILSCFTPAQLHRVFDAHGAEIAAAGLPTDWSSFRRYYSTIRKAGHYFSNGELEPNLAAVAAPMQKADGTILGAISLVTTVTRMAVIDLPKLTQLVTRAAQELTARIP